MAAAPPKRDGGVVVPFSRKSAYFLQQDLVQVPAFSLQHLAQSAHFSAPKAEAAERATEATATRVIKVFMVMDIGW